MNVSTNSNWRGNRLNIWFFKQQFADVVTKFLPTRRQECIQLWKKFWRAMNMPRRFYQLNLPLGHFLEDIYIVLRYQSTGPRPPFCFLNGTEHAHWSSADLPRSRSNKFGALDVRQQLSSSIETARHPKYVTLHKDLLKGLCIMQACLSFLLTNSRAEIPAVVRSILEQTPINFNWKGKLCFVFLYKTFVFRRVN